MKKGTFLNRQNKTENKLGDFKTVKWEPTSESEFSETEDMKNFNKKQSNKRDIEGSMLPPTLVIPSSVSPSRWDHTTPSPLSLSPSLPSLSPRQSSATGPPSNVDSAGIYLPSRTPCCFYQFFFLAALFILLRFDRFCILL